MARLGFGDVYLELFDEPGPIRPAGRNGPVGDADRGQHDGGREDRRDDLGVQSKQPGWLAVGLPYGNAGFCSFHGNLSYVMGAGSSSVPRSTMVG